MRSSTASTCTTSAISSRATRCARRGRSTCTPKRDARAPSTCTSRSRSIRGCCSASRTRSSSSRDEDEPPDAFHFPLSFTWALPPLPHGPDLLVLATELAGIGGPDLRARGVGHRLVPVGHRRAGTDACGSSPTSGCRCSASAGARRCRATPSSPASPSAASSSTRPSAGSTDREPGHGFAPSDRRAHTGDRDRRNGRAGGRVRRYRQLGEQPAPAGHLPTAGERAHVRLHDGGRSPPRCRDTSPDHLHTRPAHLGERGLQHVGCRLSRRRGAVGRRAAREHGDGLRRRPHGAGPVDRRAVAGEARDGHHHRRRHPDVGAGHADAS